MKYSYAIMRRDDGAFLKFGPENPFFCFNSASFFESYERACSELENIRHGDAKKCVVVQLQYTIPVTLP